MEPNHQREVMREAVKVLAAQMLRANLGADTDCVVANLLDALDRAAEDIARPDQPTQAEDSAAEVLPAAPAPAGAQSEQPAAAAITTLRRPKQQLAEAAPPTTAEEDALEAALEASRLEEAAGGREVVPSAAEEGREDASHPTTGEDYSALETSPGGQMSSRLSSVSEYTDTPYESYTPGNRYPCRISAKQAWLALEMELEETWYGAVESELRERRTYEKYEAFRREYGPEGCRLTSEWERDLTERRDDLDALFRNRRIRNERYKALEKTRLERERKIEEARERRMRAEEEERRATRALQERIRRSKEEAARARRDEMFAELAVDRAARLAEAKERHPERFQCFLCGTPGVTQTRKCPNRHLHPGQKK